MTALHIEFHAGKYQCVATSNGIADRRNVGPRFGSPREAARFLDSITDPVPRSGLNESLGGDGSARPGASAPSIGGMDEGSAAEPAAAGFWDPPPSGADGG